MTPIDLTDYAHSSKKIPQNLLRHKPKTKQKVSTLKMLSAYALDFYALVCTGVFMELFFHASAKSLILTKPMLKIYGTMNQFHLMILPLTLMSYFFFSFFFNEGQTWGMKTMKTRISMPRKSMRASFQWALYSSAMVFTCGVIYPFTKNWLMKSELGAYEAHDHLYETLVAERESYVVDLFKEAQSFSQVAEVESQEEDFTIAA